MENRRGFRRRVIRRFTPVTQGAPFAFGPIDPRCVTDTNEPPKPTPEQAAAHTWAPDAETWAAIKRGPLDRDATLTITGYQDGAASRAVSRGLVRIRTSRDAGGRSHLLPGRASDAPRRRRGA